MHTSRVCYMLYLVVLYVMLYVNDDVSRREIWSEPGRSIVWDLV